VGWVLLWGGWGLGLFGYPEFEVEESVKKRRGVTGISQKARGREGGGRLSPQLWGKALDLGVRGGGL